MRSLSKNRCLGGVAVAAITLATAVPAIAQEAPAKPEVPADTATSTDDIIVTAQRRAERLQDVPIAITAVTGDQLAVQKVQDLADLRGSVPGLSISGSAGVNGSNIIAIRGIQGQPLPIGSSTATAVYIDGVYLSRPDAAFFGLDDIERIEVLRGPQGTLYGRNATAGAINIVTRTPGDKLEGRGDISYGNFNSYQARGSVSGPVGGGFGFGLSGNYGIRSGYYRNILTDKNVGDRENWTVRGKLHYESTDGAFDAMLAGDVSKVTGLTVLRNSFIGALPPVFPTGTYVGVGDARNIALDLDTLRYSGYRSDAHGGSLTLNYQVSPALSLTSITGYRWLKVDEAYDIDGSAATFVLVKGINFSRAWSQELRANIDAGPVKATFGGNYYDEHGNYRFATVFPASAVPLYNPIDDTRLRAAALFGQVEFSLTRQLSIVGGLRYNHEDRDFTIQYFNAATRALARTLTGKVTDDAFIPSVGVNFKIRPDVLLYAKASKGYQAPGFNPNPGITQPIDLFDAENLWAYEAGVKSQFLDRRVTLNVAGFYYDYRDMQVRTGIDLGVLRIDNAASATIKGVEASVEVRPATGLTLSGQVTYLDPRYNDFCQQTSLSDPAVGDPPCTLPGAAPGAVFESRAGNLTNQAPRWSGGFAVGYNAPVRDKGTLHVNAQYTFESNSFYGPANELRVASGGWYRLDGTIGFTIGSGPEIYVFGRNLTDKRYFASASRGRPALIVGALNDPRTYGAGVRVSF